MSFPRLIVQRCYDLADSGRYRRVKGFFYDLLLNPKARVRPWFDTGMILLVLTSVFLLIYEVKSPLGRFGIVFEQVAVTIFILEYLLRLWLYNDSHRIIIEHYERAEFLNAPFRLWPAVREVFAKKWDYMTTPLAVIDLLAIIPSYRPLRFLRIFLLFRLFKLFRYARSVNLFAQVLLEKRFEFTTLFLFLTFVVFTAASAIYFYEAQAQGGEIRDFFDGIYWALVTISTVGYGDITPQTTEGRFVTLVLIICGITVISFTTSIIVAAFSEKLVEVKSSRVFAEIEKRGDHTIICGFGRIGQVVAARLAADREHFVVIDPKEERVALARRRGYFAVEGRAEATELLENLGIRERARRVLCLTDDDVTNVYITLIARSRNPGVEIISRASEKGTVNKLVRAGANHAVLPYKVVGLVAGEYIGQPVAFEAIYGILTGKEEFRLETVPVREHALLRGCTVAEVDFPTRHLILFGVICGLEREMSGACAKYELKARRFLFNPEPGFRLHPDDVLVLFGHRLSLLHFKDRLEHG